MLRHQDARRNRKISILNELFVLPKSLLTLCIMPNRMSNIMIFKWRAFTFRDRILKFIMKKTNGLNVCEVSSIFIFSRRFTKKVKSPKKNQKSWKSSPTTHITETSFLHVLDPPDHFGTIYIFDHFFHPYPFKKESRLKKW